MGTIVVVAGCVGLRFEVGGPTVCTLVHGSAVGDSCKHLRYSYTAALRSARKYELVVFMRLFMN